MTGPLCTDVTYANGSEQPTSFNGGFGRELQDPNGAILMNSISTSDDRLDSGELAPGGTVSGQVCFDTPRSNATGGGRSGGLIRRRSTPATTWATTSGSGSTR